MKLPTPYWLMDNKGLTYDEAMDEIAFQADCEHDRRKDEDLERELDQEEN